MVLAPVILPESLLQASPAELLLSLAELVVLASAIDLNASEGDASTVPGVVGRIAELGARSVEILSTVERKTCSEEQRAFPDFEAETFVGTRSEPERARLEDLCFAAVLELNQALRALHDARGVDEQLAAAETLQRKLERAALAIFESDGALGLVPRATVERLRRQRVVELESALAVRALFADFRRALRRSESNEGEAVLMALRYAAGGLAAISASPHYRALRFADRALLRRQRERLLEWSRAGRTVSAGLETLEDIATCADLLRDINRRQELRAHDSELIRRLLADPARALPRWLPDLERLRGLDDSLDRLTLQARSAPSHELAVEILLRLGTLA